MIPELAVKDMLSEMQRLSEVSELNALKDALRALFRKAYQVLSERWKIRDDQNDFIADSQLWIPLQTCSELARLIAESLPRLEDLARDVFGEVAHRIMPARAGSDRNNHWFNRMVVEIHRLDLEQLVLWRAASVSRFKQVPATEGSEQPVRKPGRPKGTSVDGARLRHYRGSYTQEDIAGTGKSAVSVDAIQRGENGDRWSDDTFGKVATTLTKLTGKSVSPEALKKPQKPQK